MFTKALILVLFGCSLTLALPAPDQDEGESASVLSKLKYWYVSAKNKINDYYDSAVINTDRFIQKIRAKGAYAAELGEDAIAYLKEKASETKDATLAKIKTVQQETAAKIEKVRSSTGKAAHVIAYEVKKLANQAEQTIAEIATEAKRQWKELEQEAEEYYAKKASEKSK